MNIEKQLPDFEICKLLPPGCFKNSSFVWVKNLQAKPFAIRRENIDLYLLGKTVPETYPAPLLEEILYAIADLGFFCPTFFYHNRSWEISCMTGDDNDVNSKYIYESATKRPVNAGISLYLRLVAMRERTLPDPHKTTVFQRITTSPEVLAEKLVFAIGRIVPDYNHVVTLWYSSIIPDVTFKTRTEAYAATVAKLKEQSK